MSTFYLQGTPASGLHRKIDYQAELNQEQLDVVLHGDGACLVLAGAGSGKTRTVTYRVAYLLEQGVNPASILLMTFTNKAAKEMVSRVGTLLGTDAVGLWNGTFHSIANRFLRMYDQAVGYRDGFSILDQEDSRGLIKAVMKQLKIDPKVSRFPSPAVVQDILSFCTNTLQTIEQGLEVKHPHFASFASDLAEIRRVYTERKRLANAMDFDDLLVNLLRLLEDPAHGLQISHRFQYVLVDEFQDTNAIQARIVRALAASCGNILVVGDDAQSIYAFRGADVKNILSFPKQWPDVKVFKLLTNYRSVPEILDLANDSLSHNTDQFEKELVGVRPRGEKPNVVPAASARQEAQYIAEQILSLRAQGVALQQIAVLFRSSAHTQALEFELVKRNIPYDYRGGMKFFGRAHIKDVLAFLRVFVNPNDETAWWRVLSLQAGIGATTSATLASRLIAAQPETLVPFARSLTVPSRASVGWASVLSLLERLAAGTHEPSAMVREILRAFYADYLEREYPDFRDRAEDLEQLAVFANAYRDVPSFLSEIALYDEAVATQERGNDLPDERMVLSTIHQAKGLEWDTVFLIHLADTAFPSKYATSESAIEEERRLFYVAVTRARHRLFLTYPVMLGYDEGTFCQPSMFLDELSPKLVQRIELRDPSGYGGMSVARRSKWGATSGDQWSDDAFHDDDVIAIDDVPRPAVISKTVWKSNKAAGNGAVPTSFLRDV